MRELLLLRNAQWKMSGGVLSCQSSDVKLNIVQGIVLINVDCVGYQSVSGDNQGMFSEDRAGEDEKKDEQARICSLYPPIKDTDRSTVGPSDALSSNLMPAYNHSHPIEIAHRKTHKWTTPILCSPIGGQ